MKRPRLSLRGLMVAIAVLAAGFAAWRIPWLPVRASALFTLVVFLLLTATLGSLLHRGAGWIGFALFGWGWLFLSFLSMAIGSWTSTADRMPVPMPITSMWLLEIHSSVLGYEGPVSGEAVAVIPNFQGGYTLVSYALVQVCNLWSSLLAACIGSLLALGLDASRRRSSPDNAGRPAHSPGVGVPASPSVGGLPLCLGPTSVPMPGLQRASPASFGTEPVQPAVGQ
jgi:hypothetical protein